MDHRGRSEVESGLRIFISYSRQDQAFAQELVAGLAACGFEAYLDSQDIAPGEAWEERLSKLIETCDTVVFVLSPASIASERCEWEVLEAERLGKRILPAVWKPVEEPAVPARLRRLNYIFFGEGRSFGTGLRQLEQALNTDFEWVREHTRLGELAARWNARGRPDSLLIRGNDLQEALAWRARQPANLPEPTTILQEFLAASENHEQDSLLEQGKRLAEVAAAQQKTATLQRRLATVLVVVGVGVAIAAFLALMGSAQNRFSEILIMTSAAERAAREGLHDRAMRIAVHGMSPRGSLWTLWPGGIPESPLRAKLSGSALLSRLKLQLNGHRAYVSSAAFSPDNQSILTTSDDHTAKLWDARSGQERLTLRGHTKPVLRGTFSPNGARALTTSEDGTVRVWDSATSAVVAVIRPAKSRFDFAEFTPRSDRIVTQSSDDSGGGAVVELWDAGSGAPIATLKGAVWPYRASFNPSGDRMAIRDTASPAVRIWDLETGQEAKAFELPHHPQCAGFTADWSRMLVATHDTLSVWNVESGAELVQKQVGIIVTDCPAFTPQGDHVLVNLLEGIVSLHADSLDRAATFGGVDGHKTFVKQGSELVVTKGGVTLWNVATGAKIAELPLGPRYKSTWFAEEVAIGDGSHLLVPTIDGVEMWSLGPRPERIARFGDPTGRGASGLLSLGLKAFVVSPDQRRLLTLSDRGRAVRVWDATVGNGDVILSGRGASAADIDFSSDDARLAVTYTDGTVGIWEVASGREIARVRRPKERLPHAVVFSPDGQRLAAALEDETVRVWDANTGEEVQVIAGQSGYPNIVFFGGSSHLLIRSSESGITLYDVATGKALAVVHPSGEEYGLPIPSPRGDRFVIVGGDEAALWDPIRAAKIMSWSASNAASKNAWFSDDGGRLAILQGKDTLRIVTASNGAEIVTIRLPGAEISKAVFSSDGTRLLIGFDDGAAQLWDLGTMQGIDLKKLHESSIDGGFTLDGKLVRTSSREGTIIWNAQTGHIIRYASPHPTEYNEVASDQGQRRALLAAADGSYRFALWDRFDGAIIAEFDAIVEDGRGLVRLSHGGRLMAMTLGHGDIRIWNLRWVTDVSEDVLRDRVCREKLAGAQRFTYADAADPILRDVFGTNPCRRLGPLAADYWSEMISDLWREIRCVVLFRCEG